MPVPEPVRQAERMRLPRLLTSRSLLATSVAVTAAAALGTVGSDYGSRWYRRLDKPSFQPPAFAFPLVWTALYADVAVASAAVLDAAGRAGNARAQRSFAAALGVNLVLNASWTPVSTRVRHGWLSAVHAAVLTASSADLVRRARPLEPRAATALVPYVAWCGFATVLAGDIAELND